MTVPDRVLAWVARALHPAGRVVASRTLVGGITAAMDRLTVATPAGTRDVVLRRWTDHERAAALVRREAAALSAVRGHGVPAPELVATDEDGAETGVSCTLTTALEGEPDLAPADLPSWLEQLATTQAAIHGVRPDGLGPPDQQDRYAVRDRSLSWIEDPGLRAAAREAASGPWHDEGVLVHGDYQPFNVLWRDGRLTGVVDWPHAGVGNRGTDVGHLRLNTAVLVGAEAARDLLAAYERAIGAEVDRRADLRSLLCFDLDWLEFIPRQVAGRAAVDLPGMPGRVTATVLDAVRGLG